MIDKNVSLDLMEFIETEILPRYANFDQAHRLSHVNNVIRQSLDLARKIGADINMAYAIAAYHDLGLEGPRAIHHVTSGKILLADNRLRRWFSTDKIKIMKDAVEDIGRQHHMRQEASTGKLLQKRTGNSTRWLFSKESYFMERITILKCQRSNSGNASQNILRINTPIPDT